MCCDCRDFFAIVHSQLLTDQLRTIPFHKALALTASYYLSAPWAQGEGEKNIEKHFQQKGNQVGYVHAGFHWKSSVFHLRHVGHTQTWSKSPGKKAEKSI